MTKVALATSVSVETFNKFAEKAKIAGISQAEYLRKALDKALKAEEQPKAHPEITTHHCERCGRTWEFTNAKDVPMKIIDCGRPTQNSVEMRSHEPWCGLRSNHGGECSVVNPETDLKKELIRLTKEYKDR